MSEIAKISRARVAALACLAMSSMYAQATRTWVSGVGDDANPCSRTAPCKTFAGAISKTAPAGEIDVLDPGGFGAVTITKSISIEADGVIAGVLVSGTNGIVINAPSNAVVVLRGCGQVQLGDTVHDLAFGDTVYVAPNEVHQFRNPSEEPFGFLCIVDAERDRPVILIG